jgi:hypothetical protein
LSRIALEPAKSKLQRKGATAQELFDCGVFQLGWNDALARRVSDEEIRGASGSMKRVDRVRDWYPTDVAIEWPRSVLVCQRSNAVWGRRQHSAYAWTLWVAATLWGIVGIVVAVLDGASLGDYLVTIGLPSLPAMLDAVEVGRSHSGDAARRELLEEQIDVLLETGAADERELREIQDQLFLLRRDAPLVPAWFYKLVRPGFEEDMRYAARRVAEGRAPQTKEGADGA